jgi:hypothetical protein
MKKIKLPIKRETIRMISLNGINGGQPSPSFIYTCGPSACNESSCQPTMPNVCAM